MWFKTTDGLDLCIEDPIYPWLTQTPQLTPVLRSLCTELTIQVISQELTSAHPSEQEKLNIRENNSLVRQIFILGDNTPWIYARVVVPNALYQEYKNSFDTLENKPIGETLLYQQPNIQRSDFSFARLTAEDWLYQLANSKCIVTKKAAIYARNSEFIFTNCSCSLLISEVFLPQIIQHP